MPNCNRGIILIGFGAHARRLYWEICRRDASELGFFLACVVDLESRRDSIAAFLRTHSNGIPTEIYVPDVAADAHSLHPTVSERLARALADHRIGAAIISTDPLNHLQYAIWALENGISVLLDKPVTTRRGIAHSPAEADETVEDYLEILNAYREAKVRFGHVSCEVMVQRRYHPVFNKARSLLAEVCSETQCPVTSVQSSHADGQWRLPSEILTESYHPLNTGYGKCSHSGYHFFDAVVTFLEAAEPGSKAIETVDILSMFSFPSDYSAQITAEDYKHLFAGYSPPVGTIPVPPVGLGEIDAFITCGFKRGTELITLGSINLLHNSFSQRGWADTHGRDPYKGNGRVRHESHYLVQGPFQALSLISYQSKEIDPESENGLYDVGGEYHFDLHVFRNHGLKPKWKSYEKISVADLGPRTLSGRSRGHQEDAKREGVLSFLRRIGPESEHPALSDLESHYRTVRLMSGVYKSNSLRRLGVSPLAQVGFERRASHLGASVAVRYGSH